MVFFVSGFWHGANWTFVIWGMLHALYRIVGELTGKARKNLYTKMGINMNSFWFKALQKTVTFVLVCFAWIFFRANNLSDVGTLLSSLTLGWGNISASLASINLNLAGFIVAVLSLVIMNQLDILTERNEEKGAIMSKTSMVYAVWEIAAAWLLLLSVGGASAFIYFQF
jgi:D-alanyl-lipoteichoic acid acyltransferase DltB (MBOAT superfamily)